MSIHDFQLGPRIVYGDGASARAGAELARLGVRWALVVTGDRVRRAPWCAGVLASLADAGVAHELWSGRAGNASDLQVMAAAADFARAGADGWLALGGGSALDVAKAAARVAASGGHVRDHAEGAAGADPAAPAAPLVVVPTTAGTGSALGSCALIADSEGARTLRIAAAPARVALCDPRLTASLPPLLTAATGLTALAHAIDSCGAAEPQPLADPPALHAIELVERWLLRAVADGDDLAARRAMVTASLAAELARQDAPSCLHAFAHGLNAHRPVHHGVAAAAVLAGVMDHRLTRAAESHARIAQALGVERGASQPAEQARAGIAAVRRLVQAAGVPPLGELGVRPANLHRVVDQVMKHEPRDGAEPLAAAAVEQILWSALAS